MKEEVPEQGKDALGNRGKEKKEEGYMKQIEAYFRTVTYGRREYTMLQTKLTRPSLEEFKESKTLPTCISGNKTSRRQS